MNKSSLLNSSLLAISLGVMAWVGHKAADNAEESATYAINYALDSIDYAEMAVLDAISARQTSNAM